MSILLETENLTKFFGTKLVFKDLDFQVNFGEVILILGANGSGKSTLLKILSGLVAPTYGKIKAGVNPENIGYMGHESFHYPWLSAVENLRFWASVYNIRDNDRIIDSMDRVGLGFLAHEQVFGFSRGMVQRLNLARVLLIDPNIYLLDEPSTGLDPQSQSFLHQEIKAIKHQGKTVLMVSHYPDRDSDLADRIFNLEKTRGAFVGQSQRDRD